MAAHKPNTDFSDLTEEEEELLDVSQDASQNLLDGDEEQVYNVEHTLKRLHNIDHFQNCLLKLVMKMLVKLVSLQRTYHKKVKNRSPRNILLKPQNYNLKVMSLTVVKVILEWIK